MLGATERSSLEWSVQTFGTVKLGDPRRTARAVRIGEQLARMPSGSIPQQADNPSQAKATYRFFDMNTPETESKAKSKAKTKPGTKTKSKARTQAAPPIMVDALLAPHWAQTREKAASAPVTLLIQDTTALNFGDEEFCAGLGPISTNGRDRGLFVHSVLAAAPKEGSDELDVLGLAHQTIYARTPAPEGETQVQRQRRRCESDRWVEAMDAVGKPPPGVRWVHVADREADIFEAFAKAGRLGVGCVIRAAGSAAMRGAGLGHGEAPDKEPFAPLVRALPPQGPERTLSIRRRADRPAREAKLKVSFSAVTLHAPRIMPKGTPPERLYVVRVFEPAPPADASPGDAVEWILVTNEPVLSVEDAWRIVGWYKHRWAIEEYHKCLKTGCAVESRQLEDASRLEPLVAMLCLVACRLLQLKSLARAENSPPALEAAPREHVRMMGLHRRKDPASWTCRDFWRQVAIMGGFMGRRGDGDPGWITLWRGWMQLDAMVAGARLVSASYAGPTCG